MKTPLIYALDDDKGILELYAAALKLGGFEYRLYENGKALFRGLQEQKPDLLLLDLMLPGEDGLDILRSLRQETAYKELPVIIVSAKGEESEKVAGLEGGADDYLPKPFGVLELIARIKALLRRSQKEATEDGLVLKEAEHAFYLDGEALKLTLKEYGLLKHLYSHRGEVLSKSYLLSAVWDINEEIETRTLDVHIASLRRKLGPMGANLKTVRGVGFVLQ